MDPQKEGKTFVDELRIRGIGGDVQRIQTAVEHGRKTRRCKRREGVVKTPRNPLRRNRRKEWGGSWLRGELEKKGWVWVASPSRPGRRRKMA